MYRDCRSFSSRTYSGGDSSFDHTEEILRRAKKDIPRHSFHFGGGAALVLIVLIIISLLCFAALCVISARADERLTDRYEEEVSSYYHARNLGTEFIARTNSELQQIYADIAEDDIRETDSVGQSSSEAADAKAAFAREAAYYAAARKLDGCIDPSDEEYTWHDALQEILINTGYQKEAENTPVLVFSTPVNDNEVYLIAALVHCPDTEDPAYLRILSAKTVSTVTYDYDTTLNVMKRS